MKNLSGTVKIVISGMLGFGLAMAIVLARARKDPSFPYMIHT